MSGYDRILSLDFEMYNSMHYWSICWIGAAVANEDLLPEEYIDIKVNPGTRHKLIGKELKFPFTYSELKPLPKFDGAARKLFGYFGDNTLVIGHAVDNDVKMLLTACEKYGVKCPDFDCLDTNAVYGAMKGQYSQIGLSALAEEYGVTFEAHNPVEDARATLAVLKAMLLKRSLTLSEAAGQLGITLGSVRGGLARRAVAACMSGNTREHIENYNAVFDAALSTPCGKGQFCGKKIALDGKIKTAQNLSPLVKWLKENGAEIVYDSEYADMTIGSELKIGEERYVCLRDFAHTYALPPEVSGRLNFFINKVTAESGETLNFMQYLRKKYRAEKPSGRTYCLARTLESRLDFEDIAAKLLKSGAAVLSMPKQGCVFVVDDERELSGSSDAKVRAYRALAKDGRARAVTVKELGI